MLTLASKEVVYLRLCVAPATEHQLLKLNTGPLRDPVVIQQWVNVNVGDYELRCCLRVVVSATRWSSVTVEFYDKSSVLWALTSKNIHHYIGEGSRSCRKLQRFCHETYNIS